MRRVLLALFSLFVVAAAGALWYAAHRGFTDKWRTYVSNEFRKRGFEVTLRHLTLDPMRGFVARDVHIFDARNRRRTVAVVDEMALKVNLANLLRGQTFIEALDLHDANLSLLINQEKPAEEKIEIEHLNARLILPPQQLYLAYADANVFGLHLSASGRLIHPQSFRFLAKSQNWLSSSWAMKLLEEIHAIQFEGGPPVANISFSGDLAKPEQVHVDLALWAERIRRRDYSLKSVYINAVWRNGRLDLKQLLAADAEGELRLTGLWEPSLPRIQLQLRSGLDAAHLVRAWHNFPALDDFIFYQPPTIDLRLDSNYGEMPQLLVSGEIATGKFAYRSVIFKQANAGFSWDGKQWSIRGARLVQRAGEELTGDALRSAGDFRARIDSRIDPKLLQLFISGKAAEALSQFAFQHPPHITLEAHGPAPNVEMLKVDGLVAGGPGSFRGIGARRVNGTLHFQNSSITIGPFTVEREEGEGTGSCSYDFQTKEWRFDQVRARLNPTDLAGWINPDFVKNMLPYRFESGPPALLINGRVDMAEGRETHLTIDLNAPAGMTYRGWKKPLALTELRGNLLFDNSSLTIAGISASVLGGSLSGDARISLRPGKNTYEAHSMVRNLDGQRLGKTFLSVADLQGHLDGQGEFSGSATDSTSISGQGEISVRDGNWLALPVFKAFAAFLKTDADDLTHEIMPTARAAFTISNGTIATPDFDLAGHGFRVQGRGKVTLRDEGINFDVRLSGEGLAGMLLRPATDLFECTAEGNLSEPQWRFGVLSAPN